MILEDVKLNEVTQNDNKSPYYFRSRSVTITTDKGSFTTPNRVNTRTEYVARSNVPISEALDLDLAMDFRELTVEQTSQITTNPESVDKILSLAEQFYDITRRAIFRVSIFQPPMVKLSSMSNDEKITFADFQADHLQRRFGTGIITYPYLDLPTSEYKTFIDARNKRSSELSTMFTFDMGMDPNILKELLDHIVKKKEPTVILLINRPWRDTPLQHNVISSYYDNEKTAFFACQVERIEPTSNTSNLHALGISRGFVFIIGDYDGLHERLVQMRLDDFKESVNQ